MLKRVVTLSTTFSAQPSSKNLSTPAFAADPIPRAKSHTPIPVIARAKDPPSKSKLPPLSSTI